MVAVMDGSRPDDRIPTTDDLGYYGGDRIPTADDLGYGRGCLPGCGTLLKGCGITALIVAGLIALVVALLIAGLSGGGPSGSHLPAPRLSATTPPAPSRLPTLAAPSSLPSPADPLAGASPGNCYANNGTEDDPQWQLDPGCGTGDFKVVAVEPDTTDTSSACSGVQGWDLDYPDQVGDQVLCMAYLDSSSAYGAAAGQCVFGPPGLYQAWDFASCGTGNFTVVNVYRDSTDPYPCGSGSDYNVSITVPGYPDLAKVLCLQMNFPWISTVQVNGCVWQSGSGSDTSFSPVSSCSDANAVVEGRIFEPDDGSFCGQYGWDSWRSTDYPDLGVTVCLGSPG
jgi:hypothetical protein